MVCCRARQSRSAGTAYSIAFQRLGSGAAIELMDPKRHSPNPLIVDLAANVVDDPMFGTIFHDWQSSNLHIKLTDYLDEIASELEVLESNGACNRIVQS